MGTVRQVLWIPELDRGSQTKTEIQEIRVYRVVFEGEDLGSALEALIATDGTTAVPVFGNGIEVEGLALWVNDKQTNRGSDPTYFDVTVTFSTLGPSK